ncbi:hypothetical protein MMC24_007654 [Lignoscripta atroalba]|nr:hypothetical protein [Lignoscripta atroalba]
MDPTKLCMIGKPVDTAGEFPVTLAVSTKEKIACVTNAGAKAGVACARFSGRSGLDTMDTLRPFALGQSTPPVGPTNGPADTFFNEDETVLLTTVKGDPAVNNTGFLSAFPVSGGAVSTQETRSSPAGTAVLFGTVNIPGTSNLLATDASFGAAIMSLDAQNRGTVKATAKIADQKATCWATVSSATGTGFVTDVAANHLVEIDLGTGAIINVLDLNNGNPGMIDLQAAGQFIYALSPGNATVPSAVTVFDVSGGQGSAKQIQNFNPVGVSANAMGMAVSM